MITSLSLVRNLNQMSGHLETNVHDYTVSISKMEYVRILPCHTYLYVMYVCVCDIDTETHEACSDHLNCPFLQT